MKKELTDAFLAIDKPLHDLTNAIKDALQPLITVLEVTQKSNTDTKRDK